MKFIHCCLAVSLVASVIGCEPSAGDLGESGPTTTVPPLGPIEPIGAPAMHPPVSSAPDPEASTESGSVTVGPYRLTPPEKWQRHTPRSSMIMAEFALPKAEGDVADGRLTISQAGGSVEANIERWRGQFPPKPENEVVEELEADGKKITVVDLSGNYMDSRGPMFPAEERADYRMLAAIIPEGEQSYFIKAYGPKKTMEQHADGFRAFIRSIKTEGDKN
ncbi:MAG: hypothetical protein GXY83_19575 [Rhodopirellula sp.]|nr:hypothetical protein [Rhodopirellula sp.]